MVEKILFDQLMKFNTKHKRRDKRYILINAVNIKTKQVVNTLYVPSNLIRSHKKFVYNEMLSFFVSQVKQRGVKVSYNFDIVNKSLIS